MSKSLQAHCRRMLGSKEAAEDAAHEAFTRYVARMPTLATPQDASRYLYRVATNVCLNIIRRRRLLGRDVMAGAVAEAMTSATRGESSLVDRLFVQSLVELCSERDLTIASMHFVEGTSQEEIAEVLGCTRRTVYNRLRQVERVATQLADRPAVRRAA